MANPLRGEASFKAGDQSYTLAYDINALCEAEDASGLPIGELLGHLETGASLKVLRAVIWAGLQRHHPCGLIEAGEIIAAATTKIAADAMRKALAGAFPASEGATKNPRKAADGKSSAG
jgi:hypothetical protein